MLNSSQLAYISFDTVPAPKGAAIHIAAFVQAIAAELGAIELVTVAPDPISYRTERWSQVFQTVFPAQGKTLIDRVLDFRRHLIHWLQDRHFQVIHIRSIYEGFPIAVQKSRFCDRLIFEVNGLPSIELKYRYPDVVQDRELQHKLLGQEQVCLEAADLVITPSQVTAAYLQTRGVPGEKLRVIPNGVNLDIFRYQAPASPGSNFRLLYFGTLTGWQGVTLAIEALGLYCQEYSGELTIVGPSRPAQVTALRRLAQKLNVGDRVHLLDPLPQPDLVTQMHQATAIVAPLTANDRNLVQGCCPLKVLEAMAVGTPVITSDLPVVRELGTGGTHFLLVKPSSAKSIKEAMLRLHQEPDLSLQLAISARQRIEQQYTWKQAGTTLVQAYAELGIKRAMTV